jgi:hypothetical protein
MKKKQQGDGIRSDEVVAIPMMIDLGEPSVQSIRKEKEESGNG